MEQPRLEIGFVKYLIDELQDLLEGGNASQVTQDDCLELSILKWEYLAQHPKIRDTSIPCALCAYDEYDAMNEEFDDRDTCENCYVHKTTGKRYCEGTPYENYDVHPNKHDPDPCTLTQIIKDNEDAAQREVEFLKSLRR